MNFLYYIWQNNVWRQTAIGMCTVNPGTAANKFKIKPQSMSNKVAIVRDKKWNPEKIFNWKDRKKGI